MTIAALDIPSQTTGSLKPTGHDVRPKRSIITSSMLSVPMTDRLELVCTLNIYSHCVSLRRETAARFSGLASPPSPSQNFTRTYSALFSGLEFHELKKKVSEQKKVCLFFYPPWDLRYRRNTACPSPNVYYMYVYMCVSMYS